MNVGRSSHGICVYNNRVYVCGGKRSDRDLLNSFEVYYPDTDEWIELSPCEHSCVRCLLVGFTTQDKNEFIYKIGGFGANGKKILEIF